MSRLYTLSNATLARGGVDEDYVGVPMTLLVPVALLKDATPVQLAEMYGDLLEARFADAQREQAAGAGDAVSTEPYVMVVHHGGPNMWHELAGKTIAEATRTTGSRSVLITFTDGTALEVVATSNAEPLTDRVDPSTISADDSARP